MMPYKTVGSINSYISQRIDIYVFPILFLKINLDVGHSCKISPINITVNSKD